MKSQRLTVILILLMAMMPVAVAFAHYSELASQLSSLQILTAAEMGDHDGAAPSHADHCQPEKARLANCSFHVCVDCAITSSFGFIAIHNPSHYGDAEIPCSVSLHAPPDIKPPITAL